MFNSITRHLIALSVNVTKFDGNEKAILEEKHLFFVKCWLLLKTMNF